jgi:adenine-specific DNA methylase
MIACREKNLEKTIKEARLKAKKEAGKKEDSVEIACDEDLGVVESAFHTYTCAAQKGSPAGGLAAAFTMPGAGGG